MDLDYAECPDAVKAAIPGLLRIPGRPRPCAALDTVAAQMWNGLDAAARLRYMLVLQRQLLRDLGFVNDAVMAIAEAGHA